MQPEIEAIVDNHRLRRFAMKAQMKLDNSLAAYVRANVLGFRGDMDESERTKINKQAQGIIAAARKSDGVDVIERLVRRTDAARAPFDDERKAAERSMEAAAKLLPCYSFCQSVHGFGALGLATIIAEAPGLAESPSHSHLWSRLGFAPYDGCAGSTWKRDSWRPRSLSKDEWIEHPFSGQRYAYMRAIADSLFRAQIESAAKSGEPYGRAKGPYGEAYIHRRQRTAETHPEWTKGHAHADALRYMMKRLLRDLWRAARDQGKATGPLSAMTERLLPSPDTDREAA